MKALLSNVNLDPMKALWGGEPVHCSGAGQLMPELLKPDSPARAPEVDAALVFVDGEEFLGRRLYRLPDKRGCTAALAEFSEILSAVEAYAASSAKRTVVMANIVLPPARFTSYLDANQPASFDLWERAIDERLRKAARRANLVLLDWQRVVRTHGYANLYDDRFFCLARVKLNARAQRLLAEELRRVLAAHRGATRKVLALDLDNTLWGGVLGEEGPDGIALSEDGLGKAYRDFQGAVRALKQTGVLLTIASKNDEPEALQALRRHPMMVLREEDFAARAIDWSDKASQVRALASDLGLGLDSFVLIDDNPAERHLVRDQLPEVAVPDLPPDPALLKRWLLDEIVPAYFARVALTREDRGKTRQYRAAIERRQAADGLALDDFLRRLDIRVTVEINRREHLPRLAQLTQKTNQFNMTTRRYSESELVSCLENGSDLFTLAYEDRFGKEGIVGAALVHYRDVNAEIDTFLLSCRIIGRGAEHQLLRAIKERASLRGASALRAEFLASGRNSVAAGFYAKSGLEAIEGDRYFLDLRSGR